MFSYWPGQEVKALVPIDVRKLDCFECPARPLRDFERIKQVENLRLKAYQAFETKLSLILLCESPPAKRFIYDPNSKYEADGLKGKLTNELLPEVLNDFMRSRGIWIVDTALCPLHLLGKNSERRNASTACFLRHTSHYVDEFPDVPIITIFPSNCGLLKAGLNLIRHRINEEFTFSNLEGLRKLVYKLAPCQP